MIINEYLCFQSLIQDTDEAEEQYTHALRSHLQNIDQLLELQRERLDLLQEEYQQELDTIHKEFDTERLVYGLHICEIRRDII